MKEKEEKVMAIQCIMPGKVIMGERALDEAAGLLKELGTKALIVTDRVMTELGNVKILEEVLEREGLQYTVYDGVFGEPTDHMVEAGTGLYKTAGCDFLIALGGGSALDTMKAIAALAVLGGKITDMMGKEIKADTAPMVAIPTTAGTGSEATQFTIITDTEHDVKMLLKGADIMPSVAVVDPRFTMTAPPKITAATGLDALTHAAEAYTSKKAGLLSDVFAISAVKRIFRYLPAAFCDGQNVEARVQMAAAALEAGVAFNNASVTVVHGMSRPIGALFHVPHGISNAMLIKECFTFVLDGAYGRFGDLGRAIGAADEDASDEDAARAFLQAVEELCHILEIPTLEEYGIDRERYFSSIDKMAEDAMLSGSPSNTRKQLDSEDLKNIYRSLWA